MKRYYEIGNIEIGKPFIGIGACITECPLCQGVMIFSYYCTSNKCGFYLSSGKDNIGNYVDCNIPK